MTSPAAVIVLAILWTRLALADEPGRVKIRGGWAGLGVGANRGDGVLTCGGHEYSFSLTALSIGDLGVARFTASGTVHDLNRAEHFNGSGSASRIEEAVTAVSSLGGSMPGGNATRP